MARFSHLYPYAFSEFAPHDWKMGTLIFFIRRAYTHCSTYHDMHREIETVTKQFFDCGYPRNLIHAKINITLTKMYTKNTQTKVPFYPNSAPASSNQDQDLPTIWTVLHLNWAGQAPHRIIQQIRRQLPRELSRISIATTATKLRDILPKLNTCNKRSSPMLARNIVYKYSCKCGQVYVGETLRRLSVRAKEHSAKSASLYKHTMECGFDFDFSRFSIVARNLQGREARKRCEALYIKFYNRRAKTVNIQSTSRDLILF